MLTPEMISELAALDAAADEAGGYVTPPWKSNIDPKKEEEFWRIRRYALRVGIPMDQLTEDDFEILGIEPIPTLCRQKEKDHEH